MTSARISLAVTALAWCSAPAQDLCSPHVEEHANRESGSASFRPHRDAFLNCPVSEPTFQRVVAEWLRSRGATAPAIQTIGLGRATSYPWISAYIAATALGDARWDSGRGQSRTGNENSIVASILSGPAFIKRLQMPFEATPYAVVSVSVQKVLVGKVVDVMPGIARDSLLVPYDAQLWLVLERPPRP